MTRERKTPAQRAQEAFDAAVRAVNRLERLRNKAEYRFERLRDEHDAAKARRDHLAQSPDLPSQAVPGGES